MPTFHREKSIKAEKSGTFWNPIFNYDVNTLDLRDHDAGVRIHSSTKVLYMDYLKKERNMA